MHNNGINANEILNIMDVLRFHGTTIKNQVDNIHYVFDISLTGIYKDFSY